MKKKKYFKELILNSISREDVPVTLPEKEDGLERNLKESDGKFNNIKFLQGSKIGHESRVKNFFL